MTSSVLCPKYVDSRGAETAALSPFDEPFVTNEGALCVPLATRSGETVDCEASSAEPCGRVAAFPLAAVEEVASEAMARESCRLRLDRFGVGGEEERSAPAVVWLGLVDSRSSGNEEGPGDRLRRPRT